MGDTQSAPRENGKVAAAEQDAEVEGVRMERDADYQPLKSSQLSETNGETDNSMAECNGHFEDDIAAEDEDFSNIVKSLKDEDTLSPKVEICQIGSPDEAVSDERSQVEIIDMEEKQDNIHETFRKLFSNIRFKLTVKRGSTDDVAVTSPLPEQDPMATEDIKDLTNETRNENTKPNIDPGVLSEVPDNDSTTCPTLTDETSELFLESGGEISPATQEDIDANIACEDDEQKEPLIEKCHSTLSPIHNEEVPVSAFKSFFTGGIFSSLKKKQKEIPGIQQKEVEAITELGPQDLQQENEMTAENEPNKNVLGTTLPQRADVSPSSCSTYSVPVAEVLGSQEDRVHSSPLKRLLSGSSLKRLSRKPRSRRASDGRLSASGEYNSDHYQSSTESADGQRDEILTQISSDGLKEDKSPWESFKKLMTPKKCRRNPTVDIQDTQVIDAKNEETKSKKLCMSTEDVVYLLQSSAETADDQKEDSGTHVATKATDQESAWSSFKKLMTPNKVTKKPTSQNEETSSLNEYGMKISGHDTDEDKKRKDSSVSWEAVLCGSGKKRSKRKSESDSETPQNDAGASKDSGTQSPNQAESEEGLTWKSFKKLVTPKRTAKREDEGKDNKEYDNICFQEDTFSIRKLLSGRKKRQSVEKQEILSNTDMEPTFGDDGEFETPAVVPLSEFETAETNATLQTQANLETFGKSEAWNRNQQDICKETLVQILTCRSQTTTENVTKNENLTMEVLTSPGSNEESDENTENQSKHQQLSDIPEEGIITETMATQASVADEATRDDTTADDLIEITSEAITAPEPGEVSVVDETDMISAVSQLSESSKTSGSTTPVSAENQDNDTDLLLQHAAESIVTRTGAAQICPEVTSSEGMVQSVWNQILKTFRKKSKEDKPTLRMDRNEEAKHEIHTDAAEAKTMSDIPKDIASCVHMKECDLAKIEHGDDVFQLQEKDNESLIKKTEASPNHEEYLEEMNSQSILNKPSLQVEVVISDNAEIPYQIKAEPSNTDSEEANLTLTKADKPEGTRNKPKLDTMAGKEIVTLPSITETVSESTSEDTSQEQTNTLTPKQEAKFATDVTVESKNKHPGAMTTFDVRTEKLDSKQSNCQLSTTEIPNIDEVSPNFIIDLKSSDITNKSEDQSASTEYEDFDMVQIEMSDYENISPLKESSSDYGLTFQTVEDDDSDKIILSETEDEDGEDALHLETCRNEALQNAMISNNNPEGLIIRKETNCLAEESIKHEAVEEQEVLEEVGDTTLDSELLRCHLIERNDTFQVISTTKTNETEVHTEAGVTGEGTFKTGESEGMQVLKAGEDTLLDFVPGCCHVRETNGLCEAPSTAEMSKNIMEACAKDNAMAEVPSEIRQTQQGELDKAVKASPFPPDVSPIMISKGKDISEDVTATQTAEGKWMSQYIIVDAQTAWKKEKDTNESTPVYGSDSDQVHISEFGNDQERPKESTTIILEMARCKSTSKEVSDKVEMTSFPEDNSDPMNGLKTIPADLHIPEKEGFLEATQTWTMSVNERTIDVKANNEPEGAFKRENLEEQDLSEPTVPAYAIDSEPSELQPFEKDKISPTTFTECVDEDWTIPANEGNVEPVSSKKPVNVLILESNQCKIQGIENMEYSDCLQVVEPDEERVSLIPYSAELVSVAKTEIIQVVISDPHILQENENKNGESFEFIQATESSDEVVVALAGANEEPDTTAKIKDVPIVVSDPNRLQFIINGEISVHSAKAADKTLSVINGNNTLMSATQTRDIQEPVNATKVMDGQEPVESEAKPDLSLDSEPNTHQMVENEEVSEGSQAAEQSDKTVALTDCKGEALRVAKSLDDKEPKESEPVSAQTPDITADLKNPQMVTNEDFSKGVQTAEQAPAAVALTEPPTSNKAKDYQEAQEMTSLSPKMLDSEPENIKMLKNQVVSESGQVTKQTDGTSEQPEDTISQAAANCEPESVTICKDVQEPVEGETKPDLSLDSEPNTHQMVENEEVSEGSQAAEQSDKTVALTDCKGEALRVAKSLDDKEPKESEPVSAQTPDITADLKNPQMVTNEDFSKGVQTAEQAPAAVALTEPPTSNKAKHYQEAQEMTSLSPKMLDSEPENIKMLKNQVVSESGQVTKQTDGTSEQPEDTSSQADANCEPKSANICKDVQEPVEGETKPDLNLDPEPNTHQMVENEEVSEGSQAAEQSDKTVALTDCKGETLMVAKSLDDKEPKESEPASALTSDLTADLNNPQRITNDGFSKGVQTAEQAPAAVAVTEPITSNKAQDYQEAQELKSILAQMLSSEPENIKMLKNEVVSVSSQVTEQMNEASKQPEDTSSQADANCEPKSSNICKDVQEPVEGEAKPDLSLDSEPNPPQMVGNEEVSEGSQAAEQSDKIVALTDCKKETLRVTKSLDDKERKESEPASALTSDLNDPQMVTNEDFSKHVQTAEQANAAVALTEPTTGNKTKDYQIPQEVTSLSGKMLDSESEKIKMLKNQVFSESSLVTEQTEEVSKQPEDTSSQTDANCEPESVTICKDVQEPVEGETKPDLKLDPEPNTHQMVENEEVSEGSQAAEQSDKTVALTDCKGETLMIAKSLDDKEPKESEPVSALTSDLTADLNNPQRITNDGFSKGVQTAEQAPAAVAVTEPITSNKAQDYQEAQELKSILAQMLGSESENIKMLKNEVVSVSSQVTEQMNEASKQPEDTSSQADVNCEPKSANICKNVQEPVEGETKPDLNLDPEPNTHQMLENEEVSEGSQAAEQSDKTVALADCKGKTLMVAKSLNDKEPKESEPISALTSDLKNPQMVTNEDFSKGVQTAEQAPAAVALTEPPTSNKAKDYQEAQEMTSLSPKMLDSEPENIKMLKNQVVSESGQVTKQTDGTSEQPEDTSSQADANCEPESVTICKDVQEPVEGETKPDLNLDPEPNPPQMVGNEEVSEGSQAAEKSDKTVALTDCKGETLMVTKSLDDKEPKESEPVSALTSDLNNPQKVTNNDFSKHVQTAEQANAAVALTEPTTGNKTKDYQIPQEVTSLSAKMLDSESEKIKMLKNQVVSESILVREQTEEPSKQPEYTSSQADANCEPKSANICKDVQEPVEGETKPDLNLDPEPNTHQMIENEEVSEGSQAAEQSDKTVALTDCKGETLMIAKSLDDKEPKESEPVSALTSDLTADLNNPQRVTNDGFSKGVQTAEQAPAALTEPPTSNKTKDYQEAQELKSVSAKMLDSETKNIKIVKNQVVSERSVVTEQTDIRVSESVENCKPVNAIKTIDVLILSPDADSLPSAENTSSLDSIQASKQPEGTLSQTDAHSESRSATIWKEGQKPVDVQAESNADLESEPSSHQMVGNEEAPEGCRAAEGAEYSISQVDANCEPGSAIVTKNVHEHLEGDSSSALTLNSEANSFQMEQQMENQLVKETEQVMNMKDSSDKPVSATSTDDFPISNSDVNSCRTVKNKYFCEGIQGSEQTVEGSGEPLSATKTENKTIFVIDSYNPPIVKNNDFSEATKAPELVDKRLSLPDGNGELMTVARTEGTDEASPQFINNKDLSGRSKEAEETVCLTPDSGAHVLSSKIEAVQNQNESKESVFTLDSEPADKAVSLTEGDNIPMISINTKNVQESKGSEAAGQTVRLTHNFNKQVVTTKIKDIQEQSEGTEISDSDSNNLSMVRNESIFADIQAPAAAAAVEMGILTKCNDKPVITTNIEDIPELKEGEGAGEIIHLTKSNHEQEASAFDLDKKNLAVAKNPNILDNTQDTDRTDETVGLTDGNVEHVVSPPTEEVQEQKEYEAVSSLNFDSGLNKLQTVQKEDFGESVRDLKPVNGTVALTDSNCEPVNATTKNYIQEPGESKPGKNSDSKALIPVLTDGLKSIEASHETVIWTEVKGEPKSASEFKTEQNQPLLQAVPVAELSSEQNTTQECIQTVETEPFSDNQSSVIPTEELKILDSDPIPGLKPTEITSENFSEVENTSKDTIHNKPQNGIPDTFHFIKEVSTAEKETINQSEDEILPHPNKNDQIDQSKTKNFQDVFDAESPITSEPQTGCSQVHEEEMILMDVPEAGSTGWDSVPLTEGSPKRLDHFKTDSCIFKDAPITILTSEVRTVQSISMDHESEGIPSEETLKTNLKDIKTKTVPFTGDVHKTVERPMVEDREDVVETATSKLQSDNCQFFQVVTEVISLCKKELQIEGDPLMQERAEPVEEPKIGTLKEEYLVQDVTLASDIHGKVLQENKEEPVDVPGTVIYEELKWGRASNSSEIESFQEPEFSEAGKAANIDTQSNTLTLTTFKKSQKDQEGRMGGAENMQGTKQTGSPSNKGDNLNGGEVIEGVHTMQTLLTDHMTSVSSQSLTEASEDQILSNIHINLDQEKDNRLCVTINIATVEPVETLQECTSDILPATVIQKVSEIQLPQIPGVALESNFQVPMDTAIPSAMEAATETGEEVRDMVMIRVHSVEFNDNHQIPLQVKDVDTESSRAVFEAPIEVGFTEMSNVCQETIGEGEASSATAEMKDEVIHEENKVTFEEVILFTKASPEEMSESDGDIFKTPRQQMDTGTDVSDQNEDNKEMTEDEKNMCTEDCTEKLEDIVQTLETESLDFIREEVFEESEASQEVFEIDSTKEAATHSYKDSDTQRRANVLPEDDENTGVIFTVDYVASTPPTVEPLRPPKQDEVPGTTVYTKDCGCLLQNTQTMECEQKADQTKADDQKTDLREQAEKLHSTEKPMTANQSEEGENVGKKLDESEEQFKNTGELVQREMIEENLVQGEHFWMCDKRTATDKVQVETEDDNDQDVWQDAVEELSARENDTVHSEHQENNEIKFPINEDEEVPNHEDVGDTESEGEDFTVALELVDSSRSD